MSMVTSNRLLPLLVGIVMVLTVFVTVKSCSEGGSNAYVLEAVPQAPKPDADTPADTIKTLTANVGAMTTEVRALRQDNAALKLESQRLVKDRSEIENTVLSRLKKIMRAKDRENNQSTDASIMTALTARVDALTQSLSDTQHYPAKSSGSSDIPIGLGLDGLTSSLPAAEPLVWVEPLEKTGQVPDDGSLLSRFGRSTQNALASAQPRGERLLNSGAKALNSATPVYTIPRNATLIGSVAMTALVGRVPVQGQVRDPMPFKVIVGKDNLGGQWSNHSRVTGHGVERHRDR